MQREKTLRRTPKPKRLPPQKMVKNLQANRRSSARRSRRSQGRDKIIPTTTTTTTATTGAGVALAITTKIGIIIIAIATTITTTVAGGTAIVPTPFSRDGVYHGGDPVLPIHHAPATRGTKPLRGIVAQLTIRAPAIQIRQQVGATAKAEEEEEVEEDPTKEGEAEVEDRVRI